jgi:hypothetical protein
MQINIKKSMKFITLAVFAALIATVSAQIYYSMYIQGSGIITQGLGWKLGTSAPVGASISGVTVQNLNLSVHTNTPVNFTDCLELVNNDKVPHSFGITSLVTAGSASNFTTFSMVVYDLAGNRIGAVNILTNGAVSNLPIAASQTLYVRFEVTPVTDATSGYISFTMTLQYA